MKKRFLAFALAMAMVLAMAACGTAGEENEASSSSESEAAPEFPVEVRDTIIEDAPKGVLSLTPGTTEMLFDMGYGSRVVGVSDYCDWPQEVEQKTPCGSPLSLDREMISRRPVDLVVSSVALQEDDLIWFQQQDIPVLILPRAQTFEELEANYLDLALAMSGQTSGATRGEEYYASLEEKLDDALALSQSWASAHDGQILRAIFLREMDYHMATGGTFESRLLERIGFVNDAADYTDWLFPEEQVAILEPDVIFCDLSTQPEKVATSWVYSVVGAAKNDLILQVDFSILERQSPRMFDLAVEMAEFAFGGQNTTDD